MNQKTNDRALTALDKLVPKPSTKQYQYYRAHYDVIKAEILTLRRQLAMAVPGSVDGHLFWAEDGDYSFDSVDELVDSRVELFPGEETELIVRRASCLPSVPVKVWADDMGNMHWELNHEPQDTE